MRIRTIKPDFWSSGKQLRLTDQAALLIIALWNQADDEGRMVDDPLQIAAMCPRMVGRVDQYISELERGTFLHRYRNVTGKRYIQIHDWKHHQRISKPQQSRIPAMTSDDIKNIPQLFPEHSATVPQLFHTEGNGSGREVEGKGREGSTAERAESAPIIMGSYQVRSVVGDLPAVASILEDTDFQRLHADYPASRRGAPRMAVAELLKHNPIPDMVDLREGLQRALACAEWQREGGRFIPRLDKWIESKGWMEGAECKPKKQWQSK